LNQESELSKLEMIGSVPTFLRKIARYRPRIICFVGMGIWQIVENALLKIVTPPEGDTCVTPSNSESPKKTSPSRRKTPLAKSKTQSGLGLQPYKMIHVKTENGGEASVTSHFNVLDMGSPFRRVFCGGDIFLRYS
jgi:hypothetical protein